MYYITIATSLPHLPYFERAERIPITERALDQRLNMLEAEDKYQLRLATDLLRFGRHVNADEIEKQYHTAIERISNPHLREYVDWCIGSRTAIAALRLKAEGHALPPSISWGAGRLIRHAERNWDRVNVGLDGLFPWLNETGELFGGGDATVLLRHQLGIEWRRLSQMSDTDPFGFLYVAAYVFKWNILAAWLACDASEATRKFQTLIEEVIGERQPICH
jgi:hypothetical protein